MIKILINCPSNFNLRSQSLRKIGGIETLNVNLAKILSEKKICTLNSDKKYNKNTNCQEVLLLSNKTKAIHETTIPANSVAEVFNKIVIINNIKNSFNRWLVLNASCIKR